MSVDVPPYFFRTRDNGALVFRITTESRQRRIEMEQIAVVNVKNGEVKPHGKHTLTIDDKTAIEDWKARRIETLAARDVDDILRAIDHLNSVTHWAQSRATKAQLDVITDELLMTMHDLRSVLVRKKAERLIKLKAAE